MNSGSTELVLAAFLLSAVLAIAAAVVAISYYIRRARLGEAVKNERLVAENAELAERIEAKKEEIRSLDQKVSERDRVAAEVLALQAMLESLRAEYAALEDSRREIREVQSLAAEAAGAYAEAKQELDAVRGEHERMEQDLRRGEEALARIARQEEEAKAAAQGVRAELAGLEASLPSLRAERDAALRIIEEARLAEHSFAEMKNRVSELQGEAQRLQAALAPLKQETEKAFSDTSAARMAMQEAQLALRAFEAQKAALQAQIEQLKKERSSIPAPGVDGLGGPLPESELLGELLSPPNCLAWPPTLRNARRKRTEAEALHHASGYLRAHGLSYHDRTLKGFHTALKINDFAQITVLAGVSGTGKSLLPRRYAEALGIHFLQIAVEPRWDSPQDMLGFYNYIEKRFRPTDLARLLAFMDPADTAALSGVDLGEKKSLPPMKGDHMALVLLDEMNLARIEYYFSEFLSRLEVRDPYRKGATPRLDATIPIDIRGLGRDLRLFPSHNVLFTGTMNDDESTQAISPKVMDRGNILQFAAPAKLEGAAQSGAAPEPEPEAQSFEEWRGWVKGFGDLSASQRSQVDKATGEIAVLMEGFGRPIGYRTRDAIYAYCANYPPPDLGREIDIRAALADQVEFRILPRLRGVEIESNLSAFERLAMLIGKELNDEPLAERLNALTASQKDSTNLFSWRGLTRS